MVRVVEATGGLQADEEGLRRGQAVAGVEQGTQAAAGQVLADQVGAVVVLAPVVHRHDVRMRQGCGRPGLGPEAALEGVVAGQGRVEDLDRHLAAEAGVVGQEDVRRRPGADCSADAVAAAEDAADLVRHADGGHD